MIGGALIQIIIVLLIVGVFLWALQAMPGIDATIKQIIRVLIILVAVLWVLGLVFPHLWLGRTVG